MKIAVDGYELGREARGVGRVTLHLIVQLQAIMEGVSFVVLTREAIGQDKLLTARECRLPGKGGYLRWQNGPLRRALKREKPDVLIAPNYTLPLSYRGEALLFEHDISIITHPEWYGWRYALPRRFLIGKSLAQARRIIVPSAFTKAEILSRFSLPPEKILVCGYGVEEKFRRAPEEAVHAWKSRKGLTGKVVIGFLGALNRRRHLPLLVRAVELLRRELPEAVLYLVGSDVGSLSREELAGMRSRTWVRWEGGLPEEELPLFYSSLDVFAFLSEYEGFGFPPLEALACGTPVVLLARASLREIFSGFAFMVEEATEEGVARALLSSLTDGPSRTRQLELFEAKRERFSWRTCVLPIAHLLLDWPAG